MHFVSSEIDTLVLVNSNDTGVQILAHLYKLPALSQSPWGLRLHLCWPYTGLKFCLSFNTVDSRYLDLAYLE